VKVRLAQQKGPLAVCASAGLVDPDSAFLVHRTGHSRQHAQSMMVMVAMVERILHLSKASRDARRLSTDWWFLVIFFLSRRRKK
jgi:hypothetical protein